MKKVTMSIGRGIGKDIANVMKNNPTKEGLPLTGIIIDLDNGAIVFEISSHERSEVSEPMQKYMLENNMELIQFPEVLNFDGNGEVVTPEVKEKVAYYLGMIKIEQ